MSIGQASVSSPIVPLGNEGHIKVVDHFQYLGAVCSANYTDIKELNSRIGKVSAAFRELDKVREIVTSFWTSSYNLFTTPVPFLHSCMDVSAGPSILQTAP